jgi:ABC-2 type transport system ATP-binding protein
MQPGPSLAPALVVDGLAKRYRSGEGVTSIDMLVERGEVVALLGPNGSGKTTTLRCAAGLLVPDAGRLAVCGAPPGAQAARSATCFIPDSPDLYPALTVEEHLRFRGQAFGVDDLDARIAAALEELELAPLAARYGGELSRGQRQRAVLAAAVLQDAALYLLDEPTVGLDPPALRWLARWLRERANLAAGIVVATHSLEFVLRVASRAVIVRRGESLGSERVPEQAEARELWEEDVVARLGAIEP